MFFLDNCLFVVSRIIVLFKKDCLSVREKETNCLGGLFCSSAIAFTVSVPQGCNKALPTERQVFKRFPHIFLKKK